jgi:hypothetical protein
MGNAMWGGSNGDFGGVIGVAGLWKSKSRHQKKIPLF